MACQFFQWLVAGAGPTTLQHALVGVSCVLAYDAIYRWRKKRRAEGTLENSAPQQDDDFNAGTAERRAA